MSLNIAYIAESYHHISATFIRDCAQGLSERGHRVTVFCRRQLAKGSHPNMTVLQVAPGHLSRLLLFVRFQACKRLLGHPSYRLSSIRRDYMLSALRKRLSAYNPELIFAEYGTMGIVAHQLSLRSRVRYVIHLHGYDASKQFNEPGYGASLRAAMKGAALVLVPSQHMKRLLEIQCGLLTNVRIVPYGPDFNRIETVLKNANPPATVPSIGALGRLTAKKNPLALIHAFSIVREQIPEAKLVLIGDGALRQAVETRIRELNLGDAVQLTGALPQEQALPVLGSQWVFAQHSVTAIDGDQEGLPVSILESMALGLPVVSTYHSGIPEAVTDGETGFLVREHDYETMASRLIELLRDPSLRERMGSAAKIACSERFSLSLRMDRIDAMLMSIPSGANIGSTPP